MSVMKTMVFAALLAAALFSGSAKKLLTVAANAVESDAHACVEGCGGSCG